MDMGAERECYLYIYIYIHGSTSSTNASGSSRNRGAHFRNLWASKMRRRTLSENELEMS